jgi:hypothetical protein
MWAIRVLSGQQAGQVFQLKSGANTLGRGPSCTIKILSPGVSKEHVKIEILADKFIISDMGSRNGTFLNGTQIRSSRLRPGDRIGIHDVIVELVAMAAAQQQMQQMQQMQQQYEQQGVRGAAAPAPAPVFGNLAYQMPPSGPGEGGRSRRSAKPALRTMAKEYVDRVVLPGVYRLAEMVEFPWLLALFMAAFILLVTSLSTVPLIRILRDSVEEQSQQHALTIASTLAKVNEAAVRDGIYTAINMNTAQRAGVKQALIIQAIDGKIIAPSTRADDYPKIEFVHEARRLPRESVKQIDGSTVAAVYPIAAYNAETGSRGILAYSVVEYDMTSLAVDDSKTISLFITNLFIAFLLGAVLFFFLYKIIEYPVLSLNAQLDTALREGRDDLKVNFNFDPLNKLTSNINSALTRVLTGNEAAQPRSIEHDRRIEMTNLAEMVGFAAMVITAHDRTVAQVNQGFEQRTRLDPARIVNQPVTSITDQALRLSLLDLMDRVEQNPDQLVSNELEFGGENFQIIAQGIFGTAKLAYYLMILVPAGGEA